MYINLYRRQTGAGTWDCVGLQCTIIIVALSIVCLTSLTLYRTLSLLYIYRMHEYCVCML